MGCYTVPFEIMFGYVATRYCVVYFDIVINFRILLPHMYGGINKLCSSFVELVFFYFIFAHNI